MPRPLGTTLQALECAALSSFKIRAGSADERFISDEAQTEEILSVENEEKNFVKIRACLAFYHVERVLLNLCED